MARTTFFDIMQNATSLSDIKASPQLPAGTYELEITKLDPNAVLKFTFGDFPEGTPCMEIFFRPVAAIEVDQDALDECEDWKNKVVSMRLLDADDALKLIDMEASRGLVLDAGLVPSDYETENGVDLAGICKDLKGRRVQGIVVHQPNKKNPEKPFVTLKRTAALS